MFTSPVINSTRSTKGIIRLSAAERKLIVMADTIKDVLIGIILGDAHIVKRSSTSNARLMYAHIAIAHKAYFECVYSFFHSFWAKDYITKTKVSRDKRTNKIYSSISFTTMQLPCFNVFR